MPTEQNGPRDAPDIDCSIIGRRRFQQISPRPLLEVAAELQPCGRVGRRRRGDPARLRNCWCAYSRLRTRNSRFDGQRDRRDHEPQNLGPSSPLAVAGSVFPRRFSDVSISHKEVAKFINLSAQSKKIVCLFFLILSFACVTKHARVAASLGARCRASDTGERRAPP